MKLVKELWSIEELIDNRGQIDPKPQYQRTAVWTTERKAFLIDSLLRGYDIPKFYFTYHAGKNAKGFTYEVADGQQRIRAIWEFIDDVYALKKDTMINGVDLSSLKFSKLPKNLKIALLQYELNISNILDHTNSEVSDLFTRLQKGVSLNPPELRHAMISNIGHYIDKYVARQQTNGFFEAESKISDNRFKHQDYIDHVITLIHYKNVKDLKAATIAQLYLDFADKEQSSFIDYFKNASTVLAAMKEINAYKKGIFKNKWAFVDTFWLLYRNAKKVPSINHEKFATLFVDFETERRKYNDNPEKVLKLKKHRFGKLLFDYIQAFNKEGANKDNIKNRANVFDNVFETLI